MKLLICSLIKLHDAFFSFCQNRLSCFLLLSIRLFIAQTFFYSGLSKFTDFSSAIYLFEYEYQVPFINPEIAAYLAMSFELICSVLLVAGLFTRLASLPLLAMAIVIQLTYLELSEHLYWMILLVTLICFGAGRISLDYLLVKKFKEKACAGKRR